MSTRSNTLSTGEPIPKDMHLWRVAWAAGRGANNRGSEERTCLSIAHSHPDQSITQRVVSTRSNTLSTGVPIPENMHLWRDQWLARRRANTGAEELSDPVTVADLQYRSRDQREHYLMEKRRLQEHYKRVAVAAGNPDAAPASDDEEAIRPLDPKKVREDRLQLLQDKVVRVSYLEGKAVCAWNFNQIDVDKLTNTDEDNKGAMQYCLDLHTITGRCGLDELKQMPNNTILPGYRTRMRPDAVLMTGKKRCGHCQQRPEVYTDRVNFSCYVVPGSGERCAMCGSLAGGGKDCSFSKKGRRVMISSKTSTMQRFYEKKAAFDLVWNSETVEKTIQLRAKAEWDEAIAALGDGASATHRRDRDSRGSRGRGDRKRKRGKDQDEEGR